MTARKTIGVVPLARNTFDVPLAEQVAGEALATLEGLDADIVGPKDLLFDADATRAAIEDLRARDLDLLIVLQVTFADASMTVALAETVDAPLLLWAFPEPRTGGRLRLNSFCGINLAGHALGKIGMPYAYLYAPPGDARAFADLDRLIAQATAPHESAAHPARDGDEAAAERALASLAGSHIGVVGQHPDGFYTCAYDEGTLQALTGVTAQSYALPKVFDGARAADADAVAEVRARAEAELAGLDQMEQAPTEGTLRVYTALKALAEREGLRGLAVRCWPEFFNELGCAACGAMAMLNQDGVPCACEADVYGNVTTLMLQALAEEPVFIADLVDLDRDSDTGVFWHCGLAPISMADPADRPEATVHSNRKKPLLGAFALKPGRITVARISQAGGQPKLVIGGAEMVQAPRSYSGTSGVVRFDKPAGQVLDTVMGEGLEHHYAFAYGEHREALRAIAAKLNLPVLELA
jgi:L-fucose isomerase-like protein